MSQTEDQIIQQKLDALFVVVNESRQALAKGMDIDLRGLDHEVEDVCNMIAKENIDDARKHLEDLQKLTAFIDELFLDVDEAFKASYANG